MTAVSRLTRNVAANAANVIRRRLVPLGITSINMCGRSTKRFVCTTPPWTSAARRGGTMPGTMTTWDEAFAERYDEWSAPMTADISFYVDLAREATGPLVELGVGN